MNLASGEQISGVILDDDDDADFELSDVSSNGNFVIILVFCVVVIKLFFHSSYIEFYQEQCVTIMIKSLTVVA